MRKITFMITLALIAIVSMSCKKLPSPDAIPEIKATHLNDGVVSFSASANGTELNSLINYKSGEIHFKSASASGDTIPDEQWLKTTLQAKAKAGVTITYWQWTFAENGVKSNGPVVYYWPGLDPGAVTSVTLTGVEANGTAHTDTKYFLMVHTLDGSLGMVRVSKVLVSPGLYSYVVIANKKGMGGVSRAYGYAFTGSVVSPGWTNVKIPAVDTNYNYIGGSLVAAGAGNVGKYVAIRYTSYKGDYEVQVGPLDKNGNIIWGNYWSFYKNNKYSQDDNGEWFERATANLPGGSGDDGINSVVRQDIGDSSVIIYTHFIDPFTKGFVQLQKADGSWQNVMAETAVAGYPNFGKIEIKYSAFPVKDLLVFRFGPNIDKPTEFSSNMNLSSLWDSVLQVLRGKFVPMGK